jgi:hypothetical protein
MKIKSITYPGGHELAGWNKFVFERRLRKAFEPFFSISDLDRCRATILGLEPDDERYHELKAFHCVDFKDMAVGELQALVEKTGQYVGVEITVAVARFGRFPGLIAGVATGIVIGGAGAWMVATGNDSKVDTRSTLGGKFARELDLPILPAPRAVEVSLEPVFNSTVRTNQPAATAKTLASTVQSLAGQYDVSLTVTPAEAGAEPVEGEVIPTRGKKTDVSTPSQPGPDR